MTRIGHALQTRLAHASPTFFSLVAASAAFATYFSMYAYRKPFGAATFDNAPNLHLWGGSVVDYKILLVISASIGYMISKFAGIKVISELQPGQRARTLFGYIAFAHGALLLFALVPPPYNAVALLLNGLPLGMVWGLVFGFLEGRQTSELLGACLSASFILASGYTKAVGKWLIDLGVSELWMPFAVGAIFWPVLALSVWVLSCLPPPSAQDEATRTRREPMDRRARRAFVREYWPALLPLTVLYVLLTAYRDFRDNFAAELWQATGYGDAAAVFATSENWVAFGVIVALAALVLIKDNRDALLAVHGLIVVGSALIGLSTALFQGGLISGYSWMVCIGLGLYLAYVPYGAMLFDRLIAALGVTATAGFMIYLTDASGYLGSVGLLLYRELGAHQLSWLRFFTSFSWFTSVGCFVLGLFSAGWFATRIPRRATQAE